MYYRGRDTRSYTIAIVNSEPPTFLPFLLTWHARWARQHSSEPKKAYRACEMTYLPLLLLSLYSLTCRSHTSSLSSTSSHGWEPGTSSFISHLQHLDGSQAPPASSSLYGCRAAEDDEQGTAREVDGGVLAAKRGWWQPATGRSEALRRSASVEVEDATAAMDWR